MLRNSEPLEIRIFLMGRSFIRSLFRLHRSLVYSLLTIFVTFSKYPEPLWNDDPSYTLLFFARFWLSINRSSAGQKLRHLFDSACVKELREFGDSSRRKDGEVNAPLGHFHDQTLGGKARIPNRVLRREAVRSRVANQNAIFLHFALHAGTAVE